ncbi:MAG: DUF2779 domain-containing protein [Candidatus Palauibacterales bacterium]|nr:DUF2779 domain-containing protein [Candidatus Palauibacterales bacterium]
MTDQPRLTKSLFQSGLACPKRLWWEVHEPSAPELVPDAQTQWNFRQGQEVTLLARTRVPVAQYEATVEGGDLLARVDILEMLDHGTHGLIEVKGSTSIKPEHRWDVAFQRHVAALAGVEVARTELMYLNKDCRHPDLDPLFLRANIVEEITPLVLEVPQVVDRLRSVLDGPLPGDSRNANCSTCPFHGRCWPEARFGVHRLYRMKWSDKLELERSGVEQIADVPEQRRLTSIQRRQREAALLGTMVVEDSLADAFDDWIEPLVYLDFETVSFAVPRFPGTRPWDKIPVQFSAHRNDAGTMSHHAFLAADSDDPRRAIAESLIGLCAGGGSVVTYHSAFEKGCLKELAAALPGLEGPLMEIHARVVDLEPTIAHHLYHPDFRGSFSLKVVLPTLCPDLSYEDLVVRDGSTAQMELARLLYGPPIPAEERASLRTALLAYCERDTLAMVALHARLRQMAGTHD